MSAEADRTALALGLLQTARAELAAQLDADPAWAAMRQLLAREAAGEGLEAVSDNELKKRLTRALDERVANWRQLEGLEASIEALIAAGVVPSEDQFRIERVEGRGGRGASGAGRTGVVLSAEERGERPTDGAGRAAVPEISDNVSAILNRIRSIAPERPDRSKSEVASRSVLASRRAEAAQDSSPADAVASSRHEEPPVSDRPPSIEVQPAQIARGALERQPEKTTPPADPLAGSARLVDDAVAPASPRPPQSHREADDQPDETSLPLHASKGFYEEADELRGVVEDEADVEIIRPRAIGARASAIAHQMQPLPVERSRGETATAARPSLEIEGSERVLAGRHLEPADEATVEIVKLGARRTFGTARPKTDETEPPKAT